MFVILIHFSMEDFLLKSKFVDNSVIIQIMAITTIISTIVNPDFCIILIIFIKSK